MTISKDTHSRSGPGACGSIIRLMGVSVGKDGYRLVRRHGGKSEVESELLILDKW